jgi:hypothetical protein
MILAAVYRLGRFAMVKCCDFQAKYKTDIAHRLVSTRSMCDDACCDFLAKRIQKQLSHIDWCRLGRCAMVKCCDFPAKRIQKQISHIDWYRLGQYAMMHVGEK